MSRLVKIKNSIFGYAIISSKAENASSILNLCMRMRIPYEKMKLDKNSVVLKMTVHTARRIEKKLKEVGIEFEKDEGGVPHFLSRYKKRWGILIGGIIMLTLVYLSTNYVFDIRVSGNSKMTASDVKAELSAVGFEIGSKIGKRDVDEIANSLLIDSENIAWMSINMHGNVAYVEIREKQDRKSLQSENLSSVANITAKCDGVIEYLEVFRGSPAVKEGDSVRKGELLISGISENKDGEYRTERAMGRVFATTSHEFSVKIPLVYDKKVLSDPVCTKKTIKFFSKHINIFRNYGNLGVNCVKIEKEDSFSPFGMPSLPFSIISEMTSSYETVNANRSVEDASQLAFFELQNLIEAELCDADLLRKTITTEISENEFLLSCTVICSQNIAVSTPFTEE